MSPDKYDVGMNDALGKFFHDFMDGTIVTHWVVHAEVMDKNGDMTMWTMSEPGMRLTHKLGIAAFLVEHYRAQIEHGGGADAEDRE